MPMRHRDPIAAIRAFNRFYTSRIGVLRDGLLATEHALPEARVLFELGQAPDGTDVADLRRTLELDAGYLSRLLARMEACCLDSAVGDVRRAGKGPDRAASWLSLRLSAG